ncbi:hypothetical protein [Serpentinicella alkaliphila]|uniref:Uncharacterized protein n=1 Tax=Serpentinicella alkaliphila TaxID=1734049 RepID=A0A4R2SVD8_9FIRM|nr:hypothetical protein [Serpentinicella alkaliphila]TCP93245.1 hypothetical protein EDD79_10866 [Serpentinicella alkaliphila]
MRKKQVILVVVLMAVITGGYFGVKGIKAYTDLKTYEKQVKVE